MAFNLICLTLLLCCIVILIVLRMTPRHHPLLWMTIAIIGLIHHVVPVGLSMIDQLDAFSVGVWSVDNSVLKWYGLVYCSGMFAFMCVGYICAGTVRNTRMHARIQAHDIRSFMRLCNWVVTVGLVGRMIATSRGALFHSSAQYASSVIRMICSYAAAGLPVTVYWFVRSGSLSLHTVMNCAFLAVQTLLRTGERAQLLAVGLAFLAGSINKSMSGKSRWKIVLSVIVVAAIGIGWQFVRWEWRLGDGFMALLWRLKYVMSNIVTLSLSVGELGYLYKACQTMFAIVPRYRNYLYGASLLRLLLLPLPRSIFTFKPQETQLTIAEYLGVHISGASRPITFMGDSYVNFGWAGIVAGLALGWFLRRVEQSFQDSALPSLVISAIGPYAIALWLRGTLNGIYVLFVWWLVADILMNIHVMSHKRFSDISTVDSN